VCYPNHAEATQDDMDTLLTLLGAAGVNYIMDVPGADDIMLNYQSSSFHDSHYVRQIIGLRPSPEFEEWLEQREIFSKGRLLTGSARMPPALERLPMLATERGISTQCPDEGYSPHVLASGP
jgi:ethanolamine ammonia-lyase large subunit